MQKKTKKQNKTKDVKGKHAKGKESTQKESTSTNKKEGGCNSGIVRTREGRGWLQDLEVIIGGGMSEEMSQCHGDEQ
jgi:hypothetical protein